MHEIIILDILVFSSYLANYKILTNNIIFQKIIAIQTQHDPLETDVQWTINVWKLYPSEKIHCHNIDNIETQLDKQICSTGSIDV